MHDAEAIIIADAHGTSGPNLPPIEDRELGHGPPWIGSAHDRRRIDAQWLVVMLALLGVGIVFFGFRGVINVAYTAIGTMGVYSILGIVRRAIIGKPPRDPASHVFALGLLLGLAMPMLPEPLVCLVCGGVLGFCAMFMGRAHRLRVHPVVLVLVLLWGAPDTFDALGVNDSVRRAMLPTNTVLRPRRLVVGDVYKAPDYTDQLPWLILLEFDSTDAVRRGDSSLFLLEHREELLADRAWMINHLSTGDLCRMEELFLGANTHGIGTTSRFAILVLGFYLMYRRLASWKIAGFTAIAAVLTLLCMPMWRDGHWVLVFEELIALGPAAGVTYVSYFLFATPLALIIMLLAPLSTPMSSLGRLVFSLLLGSLAIAGMWWMHEPQAAYLALLLVGLISRPLDALQRSPFVR